MWEFLVNIFTAFAGKVTDKFAQKVGETVGERIADKLGPLAPSDLELPPDTKVVPYGLRSFDERDAGFFIHLLPGPYRQNNLPESIHFWKTRIEETEPDKTFRVGLIYGPSGCGKSSLVKAGPIPHLILALGKFKEHAFSSKQKERLIVKLVGYYRDDPDPGIHGATGWLLRQWGRHAEVKEIDGRFSNGEIEQEDRRWYVSKEGLTMVSIPAGKFKMGSPDTDMMADDDERPTHPVTVSAFYLSQFEVTQQQYEKVMGENPSEFKGTSNAWACRAAHRGTNKPQIRYDDSGFRLAAVPPSKSSQEQVK